MPFRIIRSDITKVHADAIVNTANPQVTVGSGVDSAIYEAAGWDKLLKARAKIGVLNVGEVGITKAFKLPAKYIIHSSGPIWRDGRHKETELLRCCYDRSLDMAYAHRCRSIAFPLMATGAYGFPKELGIQIAIDAFTSFLQEHEMDITLVVFDDHSYHVSGKWYDDVKSFIDDGYVKDRYQAEYRSGVPDREAADHVDVQYGSAEYPGLASYDECQGSIRFGEGIRGGEIPEDASQGSIRFDEGIRGGEIPEDENQNIKGLDEECWQKAPWRSEEYKRDHNMPQFMGYGAQSSPSNVPCATVYTQDGSLDDMLKGIYTDSFEKHLQQLINKKGLKNSEVYTAANISKQYFSKLLKGKIKPSKEKLLSLAIGLRLNMDEAVDFLGLAGYAFSPISQTDKIVEYYIAQKEYSVIKINIVLFDYGLPSLSE